MRITQTSNEGIDEQAKLDNEPVWWTSGQGECEDEVVWAKDGQFYEESR